MNSLKMSLPIAFGIMVVSMAIFAILMLRIHPVSAATQDCSQIASATNVPDGFGSQPFFHRTRKSDLRLVQ
jgi:hypothetical protein